MQLTPAAESILVSKDPGGCKITIITPDFSHNCLGRAVVIADLFKDSHKVEIVGPAFKGKVWFPMKEPSKGVEYKCTPVSKAVFYMKTAFAIARSIDGEVIIVSKAVLPSLFIAMLSRVMKKVPVIIDIDDWELGFELEKLRGRGLVKKVKSWVNILKLTVCEYAARKISIKTVSNSFLQKRFGGTLVPHVRDTKAFDPLLYNKQELKMTHTIPKNKSVVLFLGTPRKHKGLEDLLEAFKKIKRDDVILLLVGFNLDETYQKAISDEIKVQLGERCRICGQQPFDKIPEFLIIADIVVIPQRRSLATVGQIPAKLFDAMAMARPVISSKVSDIPEILEGCGWTYEPGNSEDLAEKILFALDNPNQAIQFGEKARQRCIEKYGSDVVKPKIEELIDRVLVR